MLFGAGTGRVILNSWLHNVKNSAYCIFLQAFSGNGLLLTLLKHFIPQCNSS